MSCTIEIENLCLNFSKNRILENINMKVEHGDFITILGQNGAGKTSMLKAIMGFYNDYLGKIKICGELLTKKNLFNIRKKIAYLPQNFFVDKYFPVLAKDIIQMPLNMPYHENKNALEIIKRFNLENLLLKPFGVLSGGEKQKIMLAMILLREPVILLLDEPNLNLDFFAYKNFLSEVEKIYEEKNLTILFVTHLITHISELSKKVIVLKQGKIIFLGKKEELLKKENYMEFVYD